MTLERKRVHEKYHIKTKSQYKIIKEHNFTYRHLIKHINKYLKKGDMILDIGCGAGTLDFYFASKGFSITGVDISKTAIASCEYTAKNLGLINTNFKVTDFPKEKIEGKYDFIIFTEVIEHLVDDNFALKEIYKLLKNDGTLFISTPSIYAPMYKMGLADNFDKKVGHLRRYDKKTITKLVKDNNFKVLEVVENEGILRNFLYINDYAGKSIRFLKYFISDVVTLADDITLKIFGESNYFVIAKK